MGCAASRRSIYEYTDTGQEAPGEPGEVSSPRGTRARSSVAVPGEPGEVSSPPRSPKGTYRSTVTLAVPEGKCTLNYHPTLESIFIWHADDEQLGVATVPAGEYWDAQAREAKVEDDDEHPREACEREGRTWTVNLITGIEEGAVSRYNGLNPDFAVMPGTLLVSHSRADDGTLLWLARWSWNAVVKRKSHGDLGAYVCRRGGPFAEIYNILDEEKSILQQWNIVNPVNHAREGDYVAAVNGKFFCDLGPDDEGVLGPFVATKPDVYDLLLLRAPTPSSIPDTKWFLRDKGDLVVDKGPKVSDESV